MRTLSSADRARVVSRRRPDPYTERALREHARVVETLHEWRERWSRHDVQTVLVVRTRDGLRVLDFDGARASAYDVREDELEVVVQVLDTLAKRRSLFNAGATMPRRALRVEPASDVLSRCPFCDTSLLDSSYGLDVRDDELDWTPCCEAMRHAVARDGWREIFGESLRAALLREVGVVPSSVVD